MEKLMEPSKKFIGGNDQGKHHTPLPTRIDMLLHKMEGFCLESFKLVHIERGYIGILRGKSI